MPIMGPEVPAACIEKMIHAKSAFNSFTPLIYQVYVDICGLKRLLVHLKRSVLKGDSRVVVDPIHQPFQTAT